MKNAKNLITLFFVALFLLFKVAGLHALSHHSEDFDSKHCDACHVSYTINFIPLLPTEIPEINLREDFFTDKKQINLTSHVVLSNKYLSGYLLTRPPPKFL